MLKKIIRCLLWLFKKTITLPLLVLMSVYIFVIEEFIWDPAVAFLVWARKSLIVLYIESWIKKQKKGWAIATLFILPGLSVWPVKLTALYLIGHGYPFVGVSMFLVVKIVATALFAQLYAILGKECEGVKWFNFWVLVVKLARHWAQSHKLYQQTHEMLVTFKMKIKQRKSILKQRFLAALRYMRRKKLSEEKG